MKKITALLIFFGLTCCSTVTIKDTQWWGDEGSLGATSFDTLDTNSTHVDKPAWDTMRLGMICGTAAAFSELKREVEVFCNQRPDACDYQTQLAMNRFFLRATDFMKDHERLAELSLRFKIQNSCVE